MASITERTGPLGYANAKHLLRRATYKPTKALINQFASLTAAQALDKLFDFANNPPVQPLPVNHNTGQPFFPTADYPSIIYDVTYDNDGNAFGIMNYRAWWLNNAKNKATIQYRLSWFLHSIFVTDLEINSGAQATDYMSFLMFYTDKSLKELAYKISINWHMLSYLDNNLNTRASPNQNYAREFLELFTILKGVQVGPGNYTNYTEQDVQQAARVLSGFTTIFNLTSRMNYLDKGTAANNAGYAPNPTNAGWVYNSTNIPIGFCHIPSHDDGNKIFSNAFGNTTIVGSNTTSGAYTVYDEFQAFINMVFNQPETARNYARRLYRFFVRRNITTEIETDIITPLANNLLTIQNGIAYNLKSTVNILLKSVHFYDEDDAVSGDEIAGAIIKSPLELILDALSQFELVTPNYSLQSITFKEFWNSVISNLSVQGFGRFFSPFSVLGYPAYTETPQFDKLWLSSSNLRNREGNWIDALLNGTYTVKIDSAEFVRTSGNFSNPAIAATLLQDFFDLLFVDTPTGSRYSYFEQALLGGLSATSWQFTWSTWLADVGNIQKKLSVTVALDRLIKAMVKSAEYQVF